MAESAYLGNRGAEISERSAELVLPGTTSPAARESVRERKTGVSKPEPTRHRESDGRRSAASNATVTAVGRTPNRTTDTAPETTIPPVQRGIALPGDRGRKAQGDPQQRPSFWRRIALGRRGTKTPDDTQIMNQPNAASTAALVRPTRSTSSPQTTESIEKRIVEPMLQALASVESKLERSHVDLAGRSEQVEQRLSQLWDIEEQLGALGELQESLLQVSEQQRRLESAIVSQNTTLRWLVGAVFFSLAVAAFVVAAVLQ
jgi:hypothetical protein